jgi:hypothetical protein
MWYKIVVKSPKASTVPSLLKKDRYAGVALSSSMPISLVLAVFWYIKAADTTLCEDSA